MNISETKSLVCAYCQSQGSKCDNCELNPNYGVNFQLSKSARVAIDKGVMTEAGAMKMTLEANQGRYEIIERIFTEALNGQGNTTA